MFSLLSVPVFLLLAPTICHASMSFGHPSIVGESYSCAGFQGFDDKHALGVIESGWVGTSDGGRTWKQVFQPSQVPGTLHCTPFPKGGEGTNKEKCLHGNPIKDGFTYKYNEAGGKRNAVCGSNAECWCCRCPSEGPCTAPHPATYNFSGAISASVLTSPHSRHDFGNVTSVVDKDRAYHAFSSSMSTAFSVNTTSPEVFHAETLHRSIIFQGIPAPGFSCGSSHHYFGCPFRTSGRGYVRLPEGTLVMSVIVWWGGAHKNPSPKLALAATSVVAFQSTDDGYTWNFLSSILDAAAVPKSQEGPNENDLTLLADGKTIMCVVRLDAGDGPVSQPYASYWRVLSTDGGRTWSSAASLPEGVGCARPRLLRTDDGQIVLAGGRTGPTNRDTLVWLNNGRDGGNSWTAHSITYWHNKLEPNSTLHFTSSVNSSTERQTMSYTSLVRTGPQTGFIVYARRLPGTKDIAFSMPFTVAGYTEHYAFV